MPFLSLPYDPYIIFFKKDVDKFKIEHKHANFWLGGGVAPFTDLLCKMVHDSLDAAHCGGLEY